MTAPSRSSAGLDGAIAEARAINTHWDIARASAVLSGIVATREARERRGRLARRGLGAVGGAVLLVFALLRVTTTSPHATGERADEAEARAVAVEAPIVAAREGDGGFSRD